MASLFNIERSSTLAKSVTQFQILFSTLKLFIIGITTRWIGVMIVACSRSKTREVVDLVGHLPAVPRWSLQLVSALANLSLSGYLKSN